MSASVEVEVFRSDDYAPAWRQPLLPLLREVLEPVIGELTGARFVLSFLRVTDDATLTGRPSVVNLRAGYGFVHVRVVRGGRIVYQHPHSVRELVGEPLRRRLLAEHPTETHWGFGVRAPGLEHVELIRPTPHGAGQVEVVLRAGAPRRFHVEEIAEPDPPTATFADLGAPHARSSADPVVVVVAPPTQRALTASLPFSDEIEEGGFLAGRVHRSAAPAGSYLVEVTRVVPAERTGASLLGFTFTGESFLRVGRLLAGGGERLVGWYHTHLFAATDALGLSSIDVALHTSTFRAPWQVAGLVNIADGERVLRWYRAADAAMVTVPSWVAQR